MPRIRSSLLVRLTFSYVLSLLLMVIVFSGIAALLSLHLAEVVNNRLMDARDRIPAVLAAFRRTGEPLDAAAPRIIRALQRPGVAVDIFDDRNGVGIVHGSRIEPGHMRTGSLRNPDFWPGRFAGPPPQFEHRHDGRALNLLLGLHPIDQPVGDGRIVLVPQLTGLGAPYYMYVSELILLALVCCASAGCIGFWMTLGAVRPLREVTEALGYLASGDFRSHKVSSTERTEIGELAAAYNKAASRVAEAISEREHAERRMRQFIADASHELRTPLTVMLCYIDVLAKGIPEDMELRGRILRTMASEGNRMKSLVANLTLLMRLEQDSGRPNKNIDLTELVERIVAAMRVLDPRDRIHVQYLAEARVRGDGDELHEAIMNVLDNALKYAPEGPIELIVDQDEHASWVTIRDQGPGIPTEDQALIFERFYRGSERAEIDGSGLGLSIAQRAVERSGGEIRLTSATGQGTQFQLVFPNAEPLGVPSSVL